MRAFGDDSQFETHIVVAYYTNFCWCMDGEIVFVINTLLYLIIISVTKSIIMCQKYGKITFLDHRDFINFPNLFAKGWLPLWGGGGSHD